MHAGLRVFGFKKRKCDEQVDWSVDNNIQGFLRKKILNTKSNRKEIFRL